MTIKWRLTSQSTSWTSITEDSRTYYESWSLDRAQSTTIGKWHVEKIRKIKENEYETFPLHYMQDSKSAEMYLPNIFMRSI
jgi:hypothetical protein